RFRRSGAGLSPAVGRLDPLHRPRGAAGAPGPLRRPAAADGRHHRHPRAARGRARRGCRAAAQHGCLQPESAAARLRGPGRRPVAARRGAELGQADHVPGAHRPVFGRAQGRARRHHRRAGEKLLQRGDGAAGALGGRDPAQRNGPHPDGNAMRPLLDLRKLRQSAGLLAACLVLGALYAAFAPRWYRSSATLVPTAPSKPTASAVTSLVPELVENLVEVERIVVALESNAVTDGVVRKLSLLDSWGLRHVERARARLWARCWLKLDRRARTVTMSCEERDPVL